MGPRFRAKQVGDAAAQLMADPKSARAALQYGTTQGYGPLVRPNRQARGEAGRQDAGEFWVSAKDVVVTTGSQQLLYMLSEVLLDPGDIVITESPSYFVYHSVLGGQRHAGAHRADGR